MKIKKVLLDPHPLLRAPNLDVTEPWEYLEANVKRMFKVMHEFRGVGLAAPQVGWNVRLFVMNANTHEAHRPTVSRVYWNPEIIETLGEQVPVEEGCLSLPRVFGKILRYPAVRLRAMTPHGLEERNFSDYDAQIVQHEVGHLNGKLCFDNFIKETA